MQKIIRAEERYFSDMGKIQSHFLFSFADYYDIKNANWGSLRVFNDDRVGAGSGFPLHPHKMYEIMTIVNSGSITHGDNFGNQETIEAGGIQVTRAGTGMYHSEFNTHDTLCSLFQIWFLPEFHFEQAHYFSGKIQKAQKNNFTLIASGLEDTHQYKIKSKVSVKIGEFELGTKKEMLFNGERYIFLYVISGKVQIGTDTLREKDQLRVYDEKEIVLVFLEESQIIVIEST